jgi:bifunctional DNA-binding transcriptional regulator/antitoxin component of YhaV-PrlF toxin-antitoxin module
MTEEKKYDFLPEEHQELIIPVLQSYRITIPKEYRDSHGIKVGDKVKAIFSDKTSPLIVVPVEVQVIVREKRVKTE